MASRRIGQEVVGDEKDHCAQDIGGMEDKGDDILLGKGLQMADVVVVCSPTDRVGHRDLGSVPAVVGLGGRSLGGFAGPSRRVRSQARGRLRMWKEPEDEGGRTVDLMKLEGKHVTCAAQYCTQVILYVGLVKSPLI